VRSIPLSLYTLVASWDFLILLRLGCFGAFFIWQLSTVLFVFELINWLLWLGMVYGRWSVGGGCEASVVFICLRSCEL